jgi:signal transduction histidine kinase
MLLKPEVSLEDLFPIIAERAKSLVHADHASILLRRGPVLEVVHSSDGLDLGQRISIRDSICGLCLTSRQNISINELGESELEGKYVPIAGYNGRPIRSLLEVPIDFRGEAIGVLCVESTRPHAFSQVHARVMSAIASQVAIALQHVQHFQSAALFAALDHMITDPSDTHQIIQRALQRVMDELYKLHGVQLSGAQILFRQGDDELEIVHSTNPPDRGLRVSIDDSICGRAVKEHRTINVPDVRDDSLYLSMLGSTILSELAVPIELAENKSKVVIGVLNVESNEFDAFSGFNQIILENFADKVKILLAIVKLRTDLTDILESRHASDLLIAVGDQTSNLVHRLNNKVGLLAAKVRILQKRFASNTIMDDGGTFLDRSLTSILELAEQTLEMPERITRFLSEEINVNTCVLESLDELDIPASVTIETELDQSLPEFQLYSFDIVVQNIIKNAIDAMPDGGALRVTTKKITHPDLDSGYLQLTVGDTGAGIPDDILPRIFDLNFTTKVGKGEGLGLGLWWVRAFLLRSHGEISVNSKLDVGTEFVITVPLPLDENGHRPLVSDPE